jgi:CxxC motif-containing protein (DUF1111 family)
MLSCSHREGRGPIAISRLLRPLCGLALTLTAACNSLLPNAPGNDDLLEGPVDGLSSQQSAAFLAGDREFSRRFGTVDGLGPVFVATSCESCHIGDGKGHLSFNLKRFGRMAGGVFNSMRNEGGPQIQNRAILSYMAEVVPAGATGVSQFTAPSVTGLGFLEAVDDADILLRADPNDADGDGISGRPQLIAESEFIAELARLELVFDADAPTRNIPVNGRFVGRFGKKASAINLLHQTVTAYREDMGMTTDLIPEDPVNPQVGNFAGDDVPDPEVPSNTVANVVFYLKTLRAPPRRGAETPDVQAGEALFSQSKCSSCHTPALSTGPSRIAALNRVTFHPYTDLLLHDMGPELDDGYTEGIALTSEWRTAPLWGVGLAEGSQGGRGFFLHDGRAKTLREAIELHGGEASAARQAFRSLSPADQERLLAFLRSL